MKHMRIHIKNNKAFVLLFTVMLVTIVLAIAIGASNIALKELNFSTSARNTNDAFFAADIGAECALYHDKSTINKFPLAGPATAISCATAVPVFSGTANTGSYSFTIVGLGSQSQSCTKVNILKDNSSGIVKTTITSDGYNIGDGTCASTDTNRVQRELKVTY